MAVIICFSECLLILENEVLNLAEVMRSHSPIASQKNRWFQPEFAVSVRCSDMDMRRFVALVGIKVKSEGPDAQNCRHGTPYHMQRAGGNDFLPNVGGQRPLESGAPDALASEVPDGMGFSAPLMLN